MKQKLFALAFLLTAGLTSCNNDEELVKANTDYVEPGTAVIATSFYSIQTPGTKAIGDPTAAFDDEKEIKSIAFFVQVADDINLQRFESTEAIGSIGGLVDGLKENSVGNYTARFKMKMDGINLVNIYALANYAEYGLDLSAITTTGQLNAAMSKVLTAADKNPEKPLLMLGKYANTLEENKRYNADFKMDRLVARIDIINEAYNADAAKGFRLESVRLLNAKSQSSLLPDQYTLTDGISVLPQMAIKDKVVGYDLTGTATATATEADVVLQRLDTLYAYENQNTKDATAVQINGTFNGTPVAQRVEFLKVNPATGVKDQLPIGRNNLYTIKIRPSQDSTTLSFKIDVEDWTNAKGDTLVVEQKNKVPVVKAITPNGLVAATWNAGAKRIDIDAADVASLDGTLTFTAEGNQDNKVTIKYIGRKGATWMNSAVRQGELQGYEQTKAGELILKREYTIDLLQAVTELTNNKTVPSDALIMIQNINNADLCDSIRVCFRPDYEGITGAQPILMKDNRFWAPINVGATTMVGANIPKTTGNITSTCGKLFQWGRNSGVDADASGSDIYSGSNRPVGTEAGALPDMTTWKGKQIKANSSNPNTQNNWLQFVAGQDNPVAAQMVADAWYQRLWDRNAIAGNEQTTASKTDHDPCPTGWRVPTIAEWKSIGAGGNSTEFGISWDATNFRLTVSGKENGTKLFLPAMGYRTHNTGLFAGATRSGDYWSSSVPAPSINANYTYFNSVKLEVREDSRAYGFSVRCIQE